MRAATIAWLVVAGTIAGPAAAGPTPAPAPIDVPAGWAEQPKQLVEPMLAQLRSLPGTNTVAATLYLSPGGDVQLTVMTWTHTTKGGSTRSQILELDAGITSGSRKKATTHVSDSSHFDGDQLVADQIDEINGVRVHQARRHGVDTDRVVHTLIVTCAGAAAALAPCEAAQRSTRLVVASPAAFGAKTDDDDKDPAYIAGEAIGALLVVGLVVYLVRSRRNKAR